MATPDDVPALEAQRRQLLADLASVGPFQPGSMAAGHRRCGKPTSHCAMPGDPGHPYWVITRRVGGKMRSRNVPRS